MALVGEVIESHYGYLLKLLPPVQSLVHSTRATYSAQLVFIHPSRFQCSSLGRPGAKDLELRPLDRGRRLWRCDSSSVLFCWFAHRLGDFAILTCSPLSSPFLVYYKSGEIDIVVRPAYGPGRHLVGECRRGRPENAVTPGMEGPGVADAGDHPLRWAGLPVESRRCISMCWLRILIPLFCLKLKSGHQIRLVAVSFSCA